MKYESPRQYFRDMNKNPDMYPEDFEEKAKIKAMLEEDEEKGKNFPHEEKNMLNSENKKEKITSPGKDFSDSVKIIMNAEGPDASFDSEEAKIFTQRRRRALEYLARSLEGAKNYLTQVNVMQLAKMSSYDDAKKYKDSVSVADTLRRSLHNKMIADIKIAVKLINLDFNAGFPEDMRLQMEASMPERRGLSREVLREKISSRKYYDFPFPAGGFIDFSRMPKDPQGEREYIASWAMKIYGDLAVLSSDIKKSLEEKVLQE